MILMRLFPALASGVAVVLGMCACGIASKPHNAESEATGARAAGVSVRQIDGGPTYFAAKSPKSAWMDKHILLGGWLEQPQNARDVRYDVAMGDNFYWNLGGKPSVDRADYDVIRAGGMHASAPDTTGTSGSETTSYDGTDESDVNYGAGWTGFYHPPGRNHWNKDDCIATGSDCGFTNTRFYYDGNRTNVDPRQPSPSYPTNTHAVIHQGYGQGVLFLLEEREAAHFLNYSDIMSADSYWITSDNLNLPVYGGCTFYPANSVQCNNGNGTGLTQAQTHLPANYAWNVAKLEEEQALNGPSKPVVVDVETGCPDGTGACTTPPQTIAAAWHALIAGARGIIWFQHNFSGPCQTYSSFYNGSNPSDPMYNCQQTPGVTLHNVVQALTAFGHEVASLNNALLSPTAVGYVSTTGDVSTLAKASVGSCYVFAGSGKPATPPPADQSVTFNLADRFSGHVTVVDESRTLQATRGSFSDTFADANAVHVYRLGGSRCGTPVSAGLVPQRRPVPTPLQVRPERFRAARQGTGIGASRRGATISYWDSTPASTLFAVERGGSHGGQCTAGRSAVATSVRSCYHLVAAFRHRDRPGWNAFHFTGWVDGHRLAPGSYRLEATPRTLNGTRGFRRSAAFTVI